MVKESFVFENNRLCVKYKFNDNEKNMNIPFLGEKDIILNDIHITNKHPGERKMRKLFVDSGYI